MSETRLEMAKDNVYIFGAGGHGKVVASVLQSVGMTPVGFLDRDPGKIGKKILGIQVVGGDEVVDELLHSASPKSVACIAGIGDNQGRKRAFETLVKKGLFFISAVHPSCVIHPSVVVGEGTVAMPGVIVNVDSKIGENVILNTRVSIDHDCVIGDHVHLAPGVVLAGNVRVGEGAFLGAGASVIPGVTIGKWVVVGAGAVVLNDVADGETVAGVPAKSLRS